MVASFDLLDDRLSHLPLPRRRELKYVVKLLFEEFERAQTAKMRKKFGNGRILKIILFGSYARGDWVVDRVGGYFSDFDILVVVDREDFAAPDFWYRATDRIARELVVTKRLKTEVEPVVHSYGDINSQLSVGRPFFLDIVRDGIMLYGDGKHSFCKPGNMTEEQKYEEAQKYFNQWYELALLSLKGAKFYIEQIGDNKRGTLNMGAFLAHQATEHIYHCLLLVLKLYSPKSHNIKHLRSLVSDIVPELGRVWPRDKRIYKQRFELLGRAYVESRYSPKFEITAEELTWLLERIEDLHDKARIVCEAHLQAMSEKVSKAALKE